MAGGTAKVMQQRVSLITLGARDVPRLAAFYAALGWQRVENPHGVVAFDLIGQTLGLYEIGDLARDMGVEPEALGHGAMTLAYNVRTSEEVSEIMELARAAGAKVLREAGEIFWGGVIGYFADPEGHVWEVAWNSGAPLAEDGAFRWNGY